MADNRGPDRRPEPRKRGEVAMAAIREAAASILRESGYWSLTIDEVAARARVSKATIYRHWPGKAALVIDVFLGQAEARLGFPDTGQIGPDLRQQLCHMIDTLGQTSHGAILAALVAESQTDPLTAAALRERLLAPRREDARRALARGAERGELRPDLDVEATIDMLVGPVYLRLLTGHAPLDPRISDQIVGNLLKGIATDPPAPHAGARRADDPDSHAG